MAELGQTQDPAALIPGNPEAIEENARVLQARAGEAGGAADGLKAIDTGAWQGPAATAFHDKFSYEPGKWYAAADSLQAASGALNDYAGTLRWAQAQAVEAVSLWTQGQAATQQAKASYDQAAAQAQANNQPPPVFTDPGETQRQAARDALNRARAQLADSGNITAQTLRDRAGQAPQKSGWLDDVGDTLAQAGADVVNAMASAGNAMLNHPPGYPRGRWRHRSDCDQRCRGRLGRGPGRDRRRRGRRRTAERRVCGGHRGRGLDDGGCCHGSRRSRRWRRPG